VADKDVKVSEAAEEAAPAEPAAQVEQSDLEQSDLAQAEVEQAEVEQAEVEQAEVEQAEVEQAEIGKSQIVRSEAGQPGTGRRRAWRAVAALGAATIVLGGFGVWATLQANSERSSATAQNTALTDGPATAAVRREIAAAVNTIFSYNYANTAATRRAAQGLLTGPAVREYDTLFALVTKNAPAQKLVVTTKVTNTGVEMLNGDRARLLVFANQQDTRAGTGQTSYAGAMFAVTALRQGSRWKIENIDTFSG
jgi:Mce-associated membrane protein